MESLSTLIGQVGTVATGLVALLQALLPLFTKSESRPEAPESSTHGQESASTVDRARLRGFLRRSRFPVLVLFLFFASVWISGIRADDAIMRASVVDGLILHGLASEEDKLIDEAEFLLRRADTLTPNNPFLKIRLAGLMRKSGDWSGAIQAYHDAIRCDSTNLMARRGLAQAYIDKGEPMKAMPYLREIIGMRSRSSLAWYNLGLAYLRLWKSDSVFSREGNYRDSAELCFCACINLKQEYAAEAAYNLATLYALTLRTYSQDERKEMQYQAAKVGGRIRQYAHLNGRGREMLISAISEVKSNSDFNVYVRTNNFRDLIRDIK